MPSKQNELPPLLMSTAWKTRDHTSKPAARAAWRCVGWHQHQHHVHAKVTAMMIASTMSHNIISSNSIWQKTVRWCMMLHTMHRSNHVTNICWNQKKKEQPDMTMMMNRYKEPYANHLTLRRMLRSFNQKVNSKMITMCHMIRESAEIRSTNQFVYSNSITTLSWKTSGNSRHRRQHNRRRPHSIQNIKTLNNVEFTNVIYE